nr:hypothetical protein [uncultured Dyadobacter sp.]
MKDIYAIQNVKTGQRLSAYNACWWNGNRVILHDLNDWKCMTWRPTPTGEHSFQQKNLHKEKMMKFSNGPLAAGYVI